MNEFFSNLFSETKLFSGSEDGLPYWIFWFLLCIILLLVIFIFLRDKDLRQRINSFLFAFRKKFLKIRLQTRLKMIKRKKSALISELGRMGWEKQAFPEKTDPVIEELQKLENQKKSHSEDLATIEKEIASLKDAMGSHNKNFDLRMKEEETTKKSENSDLLDIKDKEKRTENQVIQHQKQLEESSRQINALKKQEQSVEDQEILSETEKQKKIESIRENLKSMTDRKNEIDNRIHRLVEEKNGLHGQKKELQSLIADHGKTIKEQKESHNKQLAEFQRELKEWEKNKRKILDRIQKIEKHKEPLFQKLGEMIDRERVDEKELVIVYSKIDRREKRIADIEKHISELD